MARRRTGGIDERTSFVGRSEELARLGALLDLNAVVVVCGPPGVGKTRLARRLAGTWTAGEALFCDLAQARDLDGICGPVARALGISLDGAASSAHAVERVGRALAGRGAALVVVDNFEQVAEHAPVTLGAWAAAAPKARLVATSRERLEAAGATVVLEPLPMPAAAQLFAERARAVRPDFEPGGNDEREIAAIVAQLDGLPLAIELAAARMGLMSARQLRERLPRPLDLLGGQEATLRRAIEWSWDLLEPWEQTALAQCAVFHGGFSLEAAEAVLVLPRGRLVLDALQSLTEKSLLRTGAAAGFAGEVRFALYETIRSFAADKLAKPGASEARHAAFFLQAGLGWAEGMLGHGGPDARRRLALEQDNLFAVFDRGMRGRGKESATQSLRAFLALSPILYSGASARHVALADQALTSPSAAAVEPALLAQAFISRGLALYVVGRTAESQASFERAIELARTAGDMLSEGRAVGGRASVLVELGRVEEARAEMDRAIEVLRAAPGGRSYEGTFLANLGVLWCRIGNYEEAHRYFEESLAVHHEQGNRGAEARALANLGGMQQERGHFKEANRLYQAALSVLRELGDSHFEGFVLANLSLVEVEQGRLAGAKINLEQALGIARSLGERRAEAVAEGTLGIVDHEEGAAEAARGHYERTLFLARQIGDKSLEGRFLGWLGALEAGRGHIEAASAALASARERLGAAGDSSGLDALSLHEGHLALAHAREAEAAGDLPRAIDHRAHAQASGEGKKPVHSEGRLALRLLTHALRAEGEQELRGQTLTAAADAPADALVAHDGAHWFRAPGKRRAAAFGRKDSLRLMFRKLAGQRLAAPGKAVTLDALFAAGWPGQRVMPEAAANRVYVALSALRKLGLKELILGRDGGYLLDPEVPLVLAPEPAPASANLKKH